MALTQLKPRVIGYLWETPVLVRGATWFPLTQIATSIVLYWHGRKRTPLRPFCQQLTLAGLSTAVILGSEWAHNLSHLYSAHRMRKPMDEFHIMLGMPRCIYHDVNDADVPPRQHIQRSIAGPMLNASLLPFLVRLRKASEPGSLAHEVWNAAVGMNVFLATASLLPIPGIDGGPILKWSLVERGYSVNEADQLVRRVNGPLAVLLGFSAVLAWLRKKQFLAFILGLLSGSALSIFLGWIDESEMLQATHKRREGLS
jgi:Zn-dependent protease